MSKLVRYSGFELRKKPGPKLIPRLPDHVAAGLLEMCLSHAILEGQRRGLTLREISKHTSYRVADLERHVIGWLDNP